MPLRIDRQRQGRGVRLQAPGHEMQCPTDRCHRQNQQHLGQQAAHEVIGQISDQSLAKHPLRMHRENSLQRHKNRHQQRQPNAETEEIHCEGEKQPGKRGETLHAARCGASAACGWRKDPEVRGPTPSRRSRPVPERWWKSEKPRPAGRPAEPPRECLRPGM